jgi:hypothetical protein
MSIAVRKAFKAGNAALDEGAATAAAARDDDDAAILFCSHHLTLRRLVRFSESKIGYL